MPVACLTMSFATDMLAEAQAAYKAALKAKSQQKGDRGLTNHDINALREQVEYWENKVAAEEARAAGKPARKPIQVVVG